MKQQKISEVFGIAAPDTALITVHPDGDPFGVQPNPAYVFRKEHIKVATAWLSGVASLLLTGPTGSGKTEFVKQIAARTSWPLFTVQAHGRMEFQELLGRVTIQTDGSTGWADGPLIRAMRTGGILLLDEADFAPPEAVGGLNAVLEGRPILIPETGEEVVPHPAFRVALTGNNFSGDQGASYRGTKMPNLALLDRTIGIQFSYLDSDQEVQVIRAAHSALTEPIANIMVQFADAVRSMHNEGRIRETMSIRGLMNWATFVTGYGGSDEQGQAKSLLNGLETALLFRCSTEARGIISGALREVAQRHYPAIF